jgi:hypothetical protein
MIFLYTALLLLVGVVYFLVQRRVAALEKKYSGVAKEADALLRQGNYSCVSQIQPGNVKLGIAGTLGDLVQ